ncbi:hypothetical protein [Paenibacillus wynnii]|uniref:Uncharacterized protein n=1 Tax=Paenibacillus wynnii TaxID=268407 RepID=A0A098MAD8_9BACL|nr:hypothetical protein [Paenibacillus wynnii]KGE18502.1 hypothetical protein PWYN_03290 [Paenibacillus wynnii]
MRKLLTLVQAFKGLEDRINAFINDDSCIEYVEGSEEVVAGGAYAWSKLKPAVINKQEHIDADYMELADRVRTVLRKDNSPNIEKFERSYELVLNYIRQDTLLWVPGLKSVLNEIKFELDLQQLYIAGHENPLILGNSRGLNESWFSLDII